MESRPPPLYGDDVSTLTASSSDTEVKAAYDDNASYVEDASATKARAFITACTILIRRLPNRSSLGGLSDFELNDLSAERETARKWLAANDRGTDAASGYVYPDVRNFRT